MSKKKLNPAITKLFKPAPSKDRKMIGVSVEVHAELSAIAEHQQCTLNDVLEVLLEHAKAD